MGAKGEVCDVLVIGAGPAGLTAGCYLARYRRRVVVVHDGRSRALRIPKTRNAPGFPGGISGRELVGRMEEQAGLYGAQVQRDHIARLVSTGQGFIASGETTTYEARSVIIATGVELNEVDLPPALHEQALSWHCLRYCPICDGYEASGKAVAVLGASAHGAAEALFLRRYTDRVTIVPAQAADLSAPQRAELAAAGVGVVNAPMSALEPQADGITVRLADGQALWFDVLYPALGCRPRSDLVRQVGLSLTDEGCITLEDAQAESIEGLFAAGDVVDGLDQISVAVGQGAVAATKAHNYLRERDGEVLRAVG